MSLGNNEKPKVENLYRIFFRKLRTRKIVYKEIYAFSHKQAKRMAKDYLKNTRKELKLLSVK
ncbi:hypothetical protein KAU51_04065 [Candidatus Parcubacteria bacterium]|nr:hypothetical protein [Candidatus Parcubacteria bacterium]